MYKYCLLKNKLSFFDNCYQHDSQELLIMLLDSLHDELKEEIIKIKSFYL